MRYAPGLSLYKTKKKATAKRLAFVWIMLALPLIQFLVFFVYTNISSVILSFQNQDGAFSLTNYEWFFKQLVNGNEISGFGYRNAILYSFFLGLNDVLLVLISTILAYFIFKKIKGRNAFRVVFFLPSIISITIYVLVYKFMMSSTTGIAGKLIPDWGWVNFSSENIAQKFAIPIYCLWVGTGYNILIIGGAMSNIPEEVIENAKLEGVGRVRELFDIVIPMIWPTLTVSFINSVNVVFTLFMQVQLISDGAVGTRTIAWLVNHDAQTNVNYAAAMGIIFTIVSIPLVLLAKKAMEKIGKHWGY